MLCFSMMLFVMWLLRGVHFSSATSKQPKALPGFLTSAHKLTESVHIFSMNIFFFLVVVATSNFPVTESCCSLIDGRQLQTAICDPCVRLLSAAGLLYSLLMLQLLKISKTPRLRLMSIADSYVTCMFLFHLHSRTIPVRFVNLASLRSCLKKEGMEDFSAFTSSVFCV